MGRVFLLGSHTMAAVAGFAAGIYMLPILTAPAPPSPAELAMLATGAIYRGEFRRSLKDSDALHWGEGLVTVGSRAITLTGKLAPGPDYKLYLSPVFLETEAEFMRVRPHMVRVGDVKTFDNFVVSVPESVDPSRFNTVIVWCETFSQFISSARYR